MDKSNKNIIKQTVQTRKCIDKSNYRVYNVLNLIETVETEKRQTKNFNSEWMAVRVPQRFPA